MPRHPTLSVSHVSSVLGERVAIEDSADPDVRTRLSDLRDQGIRHYRADSRTVPQLAVEAARPVLDRLSGTPVDLVVYCTDTPSADPLTLQMWQVQNELGLVDTPAILVSAGGCGNLGAGMRVARAFLAGPDVRTVLFVTADRIVGANGRHLEHGSTVLSDSAAACVFTAEPIADGLRVLGLATEVKADVQASATQLVMGRAIAQKIGRAVDRVTAESGVRPADCRYLLTGNFGRTPRSFLTMATRCTTDQAYHPWLADMGHCFSADPLISLATLMDRKELDPSDRLMLLSSNPLSWSVIMAEYVT